MKQKTAVEYLKYTFTPAELHELSMSLAKTIEELDQAKKEKTAVMADLNSRIKSLEALTAATSVKINNGYEMRSIECDVIPIWERKAWEIRRQDTDELVRTKNMSNDDLQMRIDEGV